MKGKHCKKLHWNKNRMVCAVLCAVLLITAISFSSMAWLTYEKQEVQQVFKGTTLEIELGGANGEYPLVPGAKYQLTGNDIPKVTIEANSVDCYVFVLREYFWYDMTYYDSDSDYVWYPIDVMNKDYHEINRENDTFNTANGDNDYGFTDYYGWNNKGIERYKPGRTGNSVWNYNGSETLSLDIKDSNGKIIGERCLFGYLGLKGTPGQGDYTSTDTLTKDHFSAVFQTSEQPRDIYILEGNENDCYLKVMDGLSKVEQTVSADRYPKIRFTAFTVQAEGLSRDQDAELVIEQIKADSTLGELL